MWLLGEITESLLPNLVILQIKTSRPRMKKALAKFKARTRPKSSHIQSIASWLHHTAKAFHTSRSPHPPTIASSQSPSLLHKSIFPRLLISTKIWTRCFWKCHEISAHVSLILIVVNCESCLGKIWRIKTWNYLALNIMKNLHYRH